MAHSISSLLFIVPNFPGVSAISGSLSILNQLLDLASCWNLRASQPAAEVREEIEVAEAGHAHGREFLTQLLKIIVRKFGGVRSLHAPRIACFAFCSPA